MLDDLPEILTPHEVADILRCSPRTLERWRGKPGMGGLPYFPLEGEVRYEKASVIAYIQRKKREALRLSERRRANGGRAARAEPA